MSSFHEEAGSLIRASRLYRKKTSLGRALLSDSSAIFVWMHQKPFVVKSLIKIYSILILFFIVYLSGDTIF